jgi:hypothetical protein
LTGSPTSRGHPHERVPLPCKLRSKTRYRLHGTGGGGTGFGGHPETPGCPPVRMRRTVPKVRVVPPRGAATGMSAHSINVGDAVVSARGRCSDWSAARMRCARPRRLSVQGGRDQAGRLLGPRSRLPPESRRFAVSTGLADHHPADPAMERAGQAIPSRAIGRGPLDQPHRLTDRPRMPTFNETASLSCASTRDPTLSRAVPRSGRGPPFAGPFPAPIALKEEEGKWS